MDNKSIWPSFWLSISLLLSLSACKNPVDKSHEWENIYTPKYAQNFKILANALDTVLVCINPNNQLDNDTAFIGKNSKFTTLSATHSAFLSALSAEENIVAIDFCKFHSSPKIKSLCASGEIIELGQLNGINPEVILNTQSNFITISGFDELPKWAEKTKLLNITPLRIWEWKETHPLAKAEWMIPFALLSNKLALGKSLFAKEETEYHNLKSNAEKKNLKVFSGNSYQGIWYCPNKNSYLMQVLNDAGLSLVLDSLEGFGSSGIEAETAFLAIQNADLWIYHGSCKTLDCLLSNEPRLALLPKNILRNIFIPYKRANTDGSNPFWEESTIHPSMLLEDYIDISTAKNPTHFYLKIEGDTK